MLKTIGMPRSATAASPSSTSSNDLSRFSSFSSSESSTCQSSNAKAAVNYRTGGAGKTLMGLFSMLMGVWKGVRDRSLVYVGACLAFAYKVWSFLSYVARKQSRAIIQYKSIRYHEYRLSPLSSHRLSIVKRKVLVLDLDETLIHSFHDGVVRQTVKPGTPPDFILKVTIDRHPVRFFVHKRPHVDFFLEMVSKWYELVVFTASMEIYGTAVADRLDNNTGMLRRRYYRQHCTLDFGSYTKDLSAINDDLSSVFILDNSPGAYRAYPDNAIPIKSWFNDPSDTALLNLLPVLDALRFVSDVRSVLSRNREAHRNIPAWRGGYPTLPGGPVFLTSGRPGTETLSLTP